MKNQKKIIIVSVVFILLAIGGIIYYSIYEDVTEREDFKFKKESISDSPVETVNQDVANKINYIVENGPHLSSNPFDYVNANKDVYDELKNTPKETFEYAIKDLITTNANKGLTSYIEALLCREINSNFDYDFESANDYLEHYKEFLKNSDYKYNEYDKYAKSLLK